MNFRLMVLSGCAFLAACSSGGDDKLVANQSGGNDAPTAKTKPAPAPPAGEEGKALTMDDMSKASKAMGLKPGTWKVRVEIADLQMKGLPGGSGQEQAMVEAVKKRMAVQGITSCITPEQAAKPSADMLAARKNANCTYDNTSIADGKIHAEMTCKPQGQAPGTMVAVMDGTYAPDRYSIMMDMKSAGANGMGMTMKSSTVGQWVGPNCTPEG